MTFSPDTLLNTLLSLPRPEVYVVAFSGGLDSTVLLAALAKIRDQLPAPVQAIHAEHGLQTASADWPGHCLSICAALDISCDLLSLDIRPVSGHSLEALAREARYRAFADQLPAKSMLLTAHHADDQAETVLMQLLRGAGVAGLAGMPLIRDWQQGWLVRPLLAFGRSDLEQYAAVEKLHWIEDETNRDISFDRNFLRHEIMPRLRQRWPAMATTISRSARHCASAAALVHERAETDLAICAGTGPYRLNIDQLQQLTPERARSSLRAWMRKLDLPLPDTGKLQRILSEVIAARKDAVPLVSWAGAEIRRHAGQLYLMPNLLSHDSSWSSAWTDLKEPMQLPGALGSLQSVTGRPGIAARHWVRGKVTVGFRREGLSCRLAGREGTRSFKRLCQDLDIPSWLRDRLPLLFIDGQLAAIADYAVCEPFAASDAEQAIKFQWERADYLR